MNDRQIVEELESVAAELAETRPGLADRLSMCADALRLARAEAGAERWPSGTSDLLDAKGALSMALSADDGFALAAFLGLNGPKGRNLADWAFQRPRPGLEGDALLWSRGNPNRFGKDRILGTLEAYGAQWPDSTPPRTKATLDDKIAAIRWAAFAHGGPGNRCVLNVGDCEIQCDLAERGWVYTNRSTGHQIRSCLLDFQLSEVFACARGERGWSEDDGPGVFSSPVGGGSR